jgi:hypothetical protein
VFTTGNYNNNDHVANSLQTPFRISELSWIVASLPVDPINNASDWLYYPRRTGNNVYAYHRVYTDIPTYDLTTQLENFQDPDGCQVRQYKYWPNWSNWCTGSAAYRGWLYEYSPDSNSF